MTTPPPAVCYRHPERPTRLACSNCGRPICVECSHDSAVGQKCPECAAPQGRHRVVTRTELRRAATRNTPVTFALIAINVIVFLLGESSPEWGNRILGEGAHDPAAIDAGEWWRAITSMFLHGGITHLLFNMWALFLFGPALERRYGSTAYAALYLACGIGGSVVYQLVGRPNPAVGASGAIFGLMGALIAATFRQRHTPAGRAVFSQLMLLLGINLFIPFVVPRVAWEAHMGGLVVGALVAALWDRLPYEGGAPRRVGVALVVAALAFVFLFL